MAESSHDPAVTLGNPNLPAQATLWRWFAVHAALLLAGAAFVAWALPNQPAEFHRAKSEFSHIARTVHPWHAMVKAQVGQAAVVFAAASPGLKLVLLAMYLSLAMTFLPLPTGPLVALAATHDAAFTPHAAGLILGLAIVGAAASTVANLTDYHVFLWLLRHRGIAKIRNTRAYKTAARWFQKAPFATMVVFNIILIPVDIPRMLAAMYGYPRRAFAGANFIGRFVRYAAVTIAVLLLGRQYDWIAPWALLGFAAAYGLFKLLIRACRRTAGPAGNE